jgi:hypothetical protein
LRHAISAIDRTSLPRIPAAEAFDSRVADLRRKAANLGLLTEVSLYSKLLAAKPRNEDDLRFLEYFRSLYHSREVKEDAIQRMREVYESIAGLDGTTNTQP